jgi:hypothetical protein
MNTGFSKAFGACVPGFRARGLCPRPGMTMLELKPRRYLGRVVFQFECNPKHRHSGAGPRTSFGRSPGTINTGFFKAFEDCVPGFRARGPCPRPGMTILRLKLRHYRRSG